MGQKIKRGPIFVDTSKFLNSKCLLIKFCANNTMCQAVELGKSTYFCQSIYPFWDLLSCQPVTYVLAEMIAVLGN